MSNNEIQNELRTEGESSDTLAQEQSRQAWVSPSFERISLNEAMNTASFIPGADATTTYS